MRIIDKSGTWVRNTGEFRLPIYDREGEAKYLEPGEDTKVELTAFIESQPQVVAIDDPVGESAPAKTKAPK